MVNLLEGVGRSSSLIRGPCARKSQTSARVKESPPKTSLSVRGISPPKPTPGIGEEGVCSPQALMRYATILNRGETCRTIAVMFRGRHRQARQEVGVAVRASFAVVEGVVERGEKLEPSLDSGVVIPHFADAFQCLLVREYTELNAPEVAAEAFEIPDDAASLHIKRSPMPFRVEHSSTDVRDGFYGAVRLPLFESGAEPVGARVAIRVKRA